MREPRAARSPERLLRLSHYAVRRACHPHNVRDPFPALCRRAWWWAVRLIDRAHS